ncbi:MAG: hypothetical protein U9Q67_03060, partial [Patescibacteria group bacterium]|nr:hypothetical protein [Patescibacteria group bacterium]
MIRKSGQKKLAKILAAVGGILWTITAIAILIPYFPFLWYRIHGKAVENETVSITELFEEASYTPAPYQDEPDLPELDTTLSEDNTLIIPSIGVYGVIHEGFNGPAALEQGIWRTHTFGTPEDNTPVIIAAHRFGYIYWSNDFRKTQSFYNLPETEVGDTVAIIWNQRMYEYEIYRAEDNTYI